MNPVSLPTFSAAAVEEVTATNIVVDVAAGEEAMESMGARGTKTAQDNEEESGFGMAGEPYTSAQESVIPVPSRVDQARGLG